MTNIPEGTRVILLDIMRTTTPETFFQTTLSEYVRENLMEFLERFHSIPEIKSTLADLKKMHSDEIRAGEKPPAWDAEDLESDLRCIVDYCSWLIDLKSDAPPLMYLEDFVWEEGYRSGKLHGEVYPEMPEVMAKWKSMGLDICTFSSGSVFSQQLIFGSTKYGDLMPLIKGYFDTSIGSKTASRSYSLIAEILKVKPDEILYFSASVSELIAAAKAGVNVVLMERDRPLSSHGEKFETIEDFTSFLRMGIGP